MWLTAGAHRPWAGGASPPLVVTGFVRLLCLSYEWILMKLW